MDEYKNNNSKYLKILGAGAVAIAIGFSVANYQKKEIIFNGSENVPYQMNGQWIDRNEDGITDGLVMSYDLNQDGKLDAIALYLVDKEGKINQNAYSLMKDTDFDGTPDIILKDSDGDGTLEEIIHMGNYPDNKTLPPEEQKI